MQFNSLQWHTKSFEQNEIVAMKNHDLYYYYRLRSSNYAAPTFEQSAKMYSRSHTNKYIHTQSSPSFTNYFTNLHLKNHSHDKSSSSPFKIHSSPSYFHTLHVLNDTFTRFLYTQGLAVYMDNDTKCACE